MIGNMRHYLGRFLPPRGFTLIEALVAVLMLTLSIAGPLTIASKGMTATMIAKDQFTAFYLAQDAIEQVRFLRDTACLGSSGGPSGCPDTVWTQSLNNCITSLSANGCYLDSLGNYPAAATPCPSTPCPVMRYDSTNKVFNYNDVSLPLTPQRFIRTIKIAPGSSADEAIVTVTVSWTGITGTSPLPVTVRETLFRWQ
jgi:Tfp pilus assembly protein PilV